ncbi:MAG: BamA/TamA family outer membrane protein [Lacibacter sp.]
MKGYRAIFKILFFCFASAFLAACSTGKFVKRKDVPKGKAFVYDNKIQIFNNSLKKDEKTVLTERLDTQLADSMQLKVKQSALIFNRLIKPAVFDTSYLRQSSENMNIFLKTTGYYNGFVKDSFRIDTVHTFFRGTQIRTTSYFKVYTGPVFRMDSIALLPGDSNQQALIPLQNIIRQHQSESYLRKGDPFSEERVSAEMDRLITLFRNNGYYKITRDILWADADTVFLKLLDPELAFDPIRQLEVFQEAQKRREQPLINVFIRLKPKVDSSVFTLFRNNEITIYPEYNGERIDSTAYITSPRGKIHVKYKEEKFKPFFIRQHLFLRPDSIYKMTDVSRTAEELNKLNLWQVIKIQPTVSQTDSSKIDYSILLVPSKRYSFSTNLESVFNQTQSIFTSAGNLVGFGLTLSLQDRNIGKQGVQLSQTLRAGVEMGVGQINPGLQAVEGTYSNSITIPKIPEWLFKKKNKEWLNKKSINTNSVSIIDRNLNKKGLFALTSVSSNFGWQFQTKNNAIWKLSPLNIEYVNLYNLSDTFKTQLANTPFLRTSFNEGFVLGNFNISFSKPQMRSKKNPFSNNYGSFRFNFEESGAVFGRLKKMIKLFDSELFEYIKADAEYKYNIIKPKSNIVLRVATGAGYLYDNKYSNMPFFKQFTGGGPNSMRAWPLRSIGPGSSSLDQRTGGRNQFFTRSGDMIFESNAEYRYNIWNIWPNTLVLRGALFVDAGNVWNFRNKANLGNDTVVFKLKNFYRDLGVSVGTGFRVDFVGLFLIRFDFGLRVKNPSYPFVEKNDGWRIPKTSFQNLYGKREQDRNWRYENFNFSLGIGYPF